MRRRHALCAAALAIGLAIGPAGAQQQGGTAASNGEKKTLRYAFQIAETGFDPAQVSDLYSRIVTSNIFEAPLRYDYLSQTTLRLGTAAAMPEVSADFRTITVRIRPGIYFADDPAFKGKRRELVAADYVYSYKRFWDPKWKSATLYVWEKMKMPGLPELRKEAMKTGRFDYDRDVEALRVVDRYTFQIRTGVGDPRFVYGLADPSINGAVAREVVEHYGDEIMGHPVGTGAFRLAEWRRSSRIVLERNENYRDVFYDEQAPAGDARAEEFVRKLKGRKLPMVDRVEISIIEENQPRWLSFLAAEYDLIYAFPLEFATLALPNGKLAPNLARRGIQHERLPAADMAVAYFNMEHPVIGGYTPDKVALRRAISLAYSVEDEIRLVRRGQAIPAHGPIVPLTFGYDPNLRTPIGEHDLARARALLDMYGYLDRDGDGYRELPDGSPLVLEYPTQPDALSRQFDELWKRNLDSIGIRMRAQYAKWPEQLRQARAGKLMMWVLGFNTPVPDSDTFLALAYGPDKGEGNYARFDLPEFNALYEKQRALPDGPERAALLQEAVKYMSAYMPYKFHVHRIINDMSHPWVTGYRRHNFMRDFWRFIDIDPVAQAAAGK
jgi:ABC-type transport system substrate-binding protein